MDSFSSECFDILGASLWPAGHDEEFYTFSAFVKENVFAGGQDKLQQYAGKRGYVRKKNFKHINVLDIRG